MPPILNQGSADAVTNDEANFLFTTPFSPSTTRALALVSTDFGTSPILICLLASKDTCPAAVPFISSFLLA